MTVRDLERTIREQESTILSLRSAVTLLTAKLAIKRRAKRKGVKRG